MINIKNNQREFTGQNVVTPWDRLKKFMFGSYPIIKTPIRLKDEEIEYLIAYIKSLK